MKPNTCSTRFRVLDFSRLDFLLICQRMVTSAFLADFVIYILFGKFFFRGISGIRPYVLALLVAAINQPVNMKIGRSRVITMTQLLPFYV